MRRFALGRWGVGLAVLLAAGCEFTKADPNAINGSVWSKGDGGVDIIGPTANDGATFRSEGSGAFCSSSSCGGIAVQRVRTFLRCGVVIT